MAPSGLPASIAGPPLPVRPGAGSAATRIDVQSALQSTRHGLSEPLEIARPLPHRRPTLRNLTLLPPPPCLPIRWNPPSGFRYETSGVLIADIPLEFTKAMMKQRTLREPLCSA
jgi:hypothetical protein